MRTPRMPVAALALAIALVACDAAPFETALDDRDAGAAADQLGALLATANVLQPRADGGGTRSGGGSIFDRLAAQIDGFGGLYRNGQCSVVVVLTDAADVDLAIRIVHAVVAPLVQQSCPAGLAVSATRGEFTYHELQRFLAIALPFGEADDVYGVRVDYSINALVITVANADVARRVLDALIELGVPAGAVVFRVRGSGGATR
jgi:hypothetical protein